jgi:branched-chain amino acid transport system permease protein
VGRAPPGGPADRWAGVVGMQLFLALTVAGITTYGCVYALTALGLVVTYTTSGIFNFAQGAMGMIGAFLYWQLNVASGLPSLLSFVLVAFVLGPLGGALVERVLMRRVSSASLEAKLTVTVGLLLFLIAVAQWRWNPSVNRAVPQFFNGRSVTIGGVGLSYDQLIVVAVAIAVAAALRLFFYRTRAGIATRAVVDDRELSGLTGASPSRYSMLGWAMGTSLACIAGILLAPTATLNIQTLTLLVINGYAAATVGQLRSLPLTFLGAIILGLLESYAIGYLPLGTFWGSLPAAVPMLYLMAVILILPQSRVTLVRQRRARAPRIASLKESLIASTVFVLLAVVVSRALSASNLDIASKGVSVAIIMLSLVLLTGYGGQVSLCQFTFAGLGAYAMGKVGGNGGSFLGLLAAVGLAAAVGIVVALPALRLRGLYLALATLAFAYGMDQVFFTNTSFFGAFLSLNVARVHIPGFELHGSRTYFVALCIVFVLAAIGLLILRRSSFGRRLLAVTDSPAACLTLGVNMTRSKLVVFAVASGLAGLGGALYGGAQGVIGPNDFTFLVSSTVLMLAVVWGIRTIGGMFVGAVIIAFGPSVQNWIEGRWSGSPTNLLQLLIGLAAIGIAQNPEGVFGAKTPLEALRTRRQRNPRAGALELTRGA